MPVTATALRKSLFDSLDRALKGDPVTVTYKGAELQIVAQHSDSKLARAVRRNAIVGDPDDLIHSDRDLLNDLEQQWTSESER
jgi:antitoxin (DNA-binding transcriptional repressor) of toxin-antitoxin stability system